MNRHSHYNKTLVNAIKDYILVDENKEEVISELKRYKKEFNSETDYNWYSYGNILPYYYQIREFYKKNEVEVSDDDCIMCEHFKRHVGKAIDEILAENK